MFGANISSQAMLFAKSGLELLILTVFQHENQFIYPLTWAIVFALVFTAVLQVCVTHINAQTLLLNSSKMQLYYLNRGVQLCDTIILVPLNFCSFNVSCLFNGLVYYNQWDRLFWWQVVAVLVGIAILVWGVLVISLQPSFIALPEDEDDDRTGRSRSISSNYSQPFLKAVSSLDEEGVCVKKTRWWTKMKSMYQEEHQEQNKQQEVEAEPDEHTGLLTSI